MGKILFSVSAILCVVVHFVIYCYLPYDPKNGYENMISKLEYYLATIILLIVVIRQFYDGITAWIEISLENVTWSYPIVRCSFWAMYHWLCCRNPCSYDDCCNESAFAIDDPYNLMELGFNHLYNQHNIWMEEYNEIIAQVDEGNWENIGKGKVYGENSPYALYFKLEEARKKQLEAKSVAEQSDVVKDDDNNPTESVNGGGGSDEGEIKVDSAVDDEVVNKDKMMEYSEDAVEIQMECSEGGEDKINIDV